MSDKLLNDVFKATASIGRLAYVALLGGTLFILLIFFANVFIYLCSHVSESLIELIDYIFAG